MFEYFLQNPVALYALIIWILFWKGMSMWKAARENQKEWFIALLVINTFGVLDIFYLYILPKIQNKLKNKKEETSVVSS